MQRAPGLLVLDDSLVAGCCRLYLARQTPAVKRARGRGPRNDAPPPPRDQSRCVKLSCWALVKTPTTSSPASLRCCTSCASPGRCPTDAGKSRKACANLYRLADPTDSTTQPEPGPARATAVALLHFPGPRRARRNCTQWVAQLFETLGVDPQVVDVERLLDVTREVAHGVVRPAGAP
ncbi:MAG: DUF6457 domain-containing protein [Dermatophilaceae bacterium]